MCELYGVIDLLAHFGVSVHANMFSTTLLSSSSSSSPASFAPQHQHAVAGPVFVHNGCNLFTTLALSLILLTAVYIFVLSALLAFYISRLPNDPGVNEIFKKISGVVPWLLSWSRAALVAIRSRHESLLIEQTCPVSAHAAPDTRCIICLDSMKAGDATRILRCNHAFHRPCIDAWIGKGANRCPLCNARIIPIASVSRKSQRRESPAAVRAAAAAASAAAAVANAVATAPEERSNEQPVRVPWRRRLWMRFRRRRT